MQSLEQLIGRIIDPAPRRADAAPAPRTATEPLETLIGRMISAPAGPQRPAPASPLIAITLPDSPEIPSR